MLADGPIRVMPASYQPRGLVIDVGVDEAPENEAEIIISDKPARPPEKRMFAANV